MDERKENMDTNPPDVEDKPIIQRISKLLEKKCWTDCTFVIGGEDCETKEFKAHKLILASCTPVFAAMLYGNAAETESIIKIVDMKPKTFDVILKYIYGVDINFSSLVQAIEIYYAAKKYILVNLQKKCSKYIVSKVDYETALEAYEFAELFDDSEILERARWIIQKDAARLLEDDEALDIKFQTLLSILDQEKLCISEKNLCKAVERWMDKNVPKDDFGKYNEAARGEFIRPALKRIRFRAMTSEEFANHLARSSLFTRDESYSILMCLCTNNSDDSHPLPEGFSYLSSPRFTEGDLLCSIKQAKYPVDDDWYKLQQMEGSRTIFDDDMW